MKNDTFTPKNTGNTLLMYRTEALDVFSVQVGKVRNRSTQNLLESGVLTKEQTLILKDGKLTFNIADYSNTIGLSVTQDQLMCYIQQKFTAQNSQEQVNYPILIDVAEYQNLKQMKTTARSNFIRKMKQDIELLSGVTIYDQTTTETGDARFTGKYHFISTLFKEEIEKDKNNGIKVVNGQVLVFVDPLYAKRMLENNTLTNYPQTLYLYRGTEPTAYNVGKKLAQRWQNPKNQLKGEQDIISVKKLLQAAGLPSLEKLAKHNNQSKWKQMLLEPLEKALERAVDIGLLNEWSFVKANKETLTDSELDRLEKGIDFNFFEKLYIHFDLNGEDVRPVAKKRLAAEKKTKKAPGKKSKKM